jgi:hypothetical protein
VNPHVVNLFCHKLAADEPVRGLWMTLESPSLTGMAVGLDLDRVLINAELARIRPLIERAVMFPIPTIASLPMRLTNN